jgi:hypothetical protein
MLEKYLPVGSIVLLTGGTKRLMITGYCMQTEERPGVIYDYSGCLYPEGVIRSDVTSVFNHDQIERIDFVGFTDEEGKSFTDELNNKLKDVEEHQKFINEQNEEEEANLLALNVLNEIGTEEEEEDDDEDSDEDFIITDDDEEDSELIFDEDDEEDEEDDNDSEEESEEDEEPNPLLSELEKEDNTNLPINNQIFTDDIEKI